MPVATPPNAIVFGTGMVTQRDMMRAGLVLNLCFTVILTALAAAFF
jgi:sodium-dependent dicarboxylate transporter 2/3/5